MKTYLEISISGSDSQRELLIPTMIELGCIGFTETETDLVCYFDKTRWKENQIERIHSDIRQLLRIISSNANVKLKTIVEENWNLQWERTIQPIEIGERLVVKPTWASYPDKNGKLLLHIDPRMSFGTGYHETTRLMLRLLEKYMRGGESVLDVGTGTGILAIAAVKLGAAEAIGIDNDPWSIENARENVTTNKVEHQVTITNTSLQDLAESLFDLLAANITAQTILELLPEISRHLRRNGLLLLSGLLLQDEAKLAAELSRSGYAIVEKLSENEWLAVAAGRTP